MIFRVEVYDRQNLNLNMLTKFSIKSPPNAAEILSYDI